MATPPQVRPCIGYQLLTDDYKDQVVDFFYDVFFKDDPISVAYGGFIERDEAFIALLQTVVQDGVSLIAVDPLQV